VKRPFIWGVDFDLGLFSFIWAICVDLDQPRSRQLFKMFCAIWGAALFTLFLSIWGDLLFAECRPICTFFIVF
jgi:hypothetical protein